MTELKHMDIASRNQRLRETLEGMGLFVLPIYSESDPQRIDYMQVSAGLPAYVTKGVTEVPTVRAVAEPVSGSEVVRLVTPTESGGNNVVDFPAVLGSNAIL